jgi:hypothetical protein
LWSIYGALTKNNPCNIEGAFDLDDEFFELQSDDDSSDSTTVHCNSSFELPLMIPNVIEAVASVCRTVKVTLNTSMGKHLSNSDQTLHGHPRIG